MNERIKQLAEQAGFRLHLDGEFYTANHKHLPITEDIEKFAELIVRECISVMNTTAKEAQENFTYMDNDVPTTAHQFEIRKHFGVEK